MSLPPGTRLPFFWERNVSKAVDGAYYRGLVEGLTLGAIAGGLVAMLCTALAWAHMGG